MPLKRHFEFEWADNEIKARVLKDLLDLVQLFAAQRPWLGHGRQ
jgi:hypothetical protein